MTIAQQWNELAGRQAFAERVDDYGLPADGLWNVPQIQGNQHLHEPTVTINVGSFRVRDGALEVTRWSEAFAEQTLAMLHRDRGQALQVAIGQCVREFLQRLPQ